MLVFVACNYEKLPFTGYRDVFREVQAAEPRIRFSFADARISNQSIMEKVKHGIQACDVGLYDVTFRNPNVMMELGMAIGAGKPWNILYNPHLDQINDRRGWFARPNRNLQLPANLRGYEYIEYVDKEQLRTKLVLWVSQKLAESEVQTVSRWARFEAEILSLLASNANLTMREIAGRAGIEVEMARLAVVELRKKGRVVSNGQRGVGARYSLVQGTGRGVSPTHAQA